MTGALLDSGDGTLRQQSMQQLRELVAGGAAGHEVVAWFDGLPSARQPLWPATIDQEAALLPKLHKVLSDENHFQVRHIHIIILHVDNTQTWQHCALCADPGCSTVEFAYDGPRQTRALWRCEARTAVGKFREACSEASGFSSALLGSYTCSQTRG